LVLPMLLEVLFLPSLATVAYGWAKERVGGAVDGARAGVDPVAL
jgi:hypothetical protein